MTGLTTGAFEDTTNTDTVTAADKYCYQTVASSAGTATFSLLSVVFASAPYTTSSLESVPLGAATGTTFSTASQTAYNPLTAELTSAITTESSAQIALWKVGTVRYLTCYASANARTTTTTIRTRKNAANGGSSITYASGVSGLAEDTVNTDTVAADDKFDFQSVTGTGTQTLTMQSFGIDYITSTGSGLNSCSRAGALVQGTATTNYAPINGSINAAGLLESFWQLKARDAFGYSHLSTNITANDVTSTSTMRTRDSGADGLMSISIAASTTGFLEDTVNTESFVSTDLINYQIATGVTGTNMTIRNLGMFSLLQTSQLFERAPSTETTAISESISRFKKGIRNLTTETTTVSETLARLASKFRSPTTETTTISETLARFASKFRSPATETTTISETLSRIKIKIRDMATETITSSETISRFKKGIRDLATETIVVGETLTRFALKTRSLPETTVVSETLSRMATKFRSVSTETTIIAETLSRINIRIRNMVAETIVIGETLARISNKFRALSTETTVISETLVRDIGKFRSLATESITIGETLSKVPIRSPATETTAISEQISRFYKAIRNMSTETVAVSETLSIMAIKFIGLSENTSISESADRVVVKSRAPGTEVTAIDEVLSRLRTISKSIEETTSISDSLTRFKKAIRKLSEVYSNFEPDNFGENFRVNIISDSISTLITRVRPISTETVPNTESIARLAIKSRNLDVETTTITDSVTRFKKAIRVITASGGNFFSENFQPGNFWTQEASGSEADVVVSDSILIVAVKPRSIPTESTTISESISRFKLAIRGLSETTTVSETLSRIASKFISLGQTVTVSESIAKLATRVRPISTEEIATGESLVRTAYKTRILTQSTEIVDSITPIPTRVRTVPVESTSITDNINRSLLAIRTLSETTIINESLITISGRFAVMNENTAIGESLSRFKKAFRYITASGGNFLIENYISENFVTSEEEGSEPKIPINESILRVAVKPRSIPTETTSITETLQTDIFLLITRGLGETVNISETLARSALKSRSLGETTAINEALDETPIRKVNVIETVNAVDTISPLVARLLSQNIPIEETLTRSATKLRSLSESTIMTASIDEMVIATRSLSTENTPVSETLSRTTKHMRTISEAVSLNDITNRLLYAFRSMTETVPITDSVSTIRSVLVSMSETINITESMPTRLTKLVRLLVENIRVAELLHMEGGIETQLLPDPGSSVGKFHFIRTPFKTPSTRKPGVIDAVVNRAYAEIWVLEMSLLYTGKAITEAIQLAVEQYTRASALLQITVPSVLKARMDISIPEILYLAKNDSIELSDIDHIYAKAKIIDTEKQDKVFQLLTSYLVYDTMDKEGHEELLRYYNASKKTKDPKKQNELIELMKSYMAVDMIDGN